LCVGELLDELRAVSDDNARLETELVTSKRDLDAMLDLLRRKERQFSDERKSLHVKNKELAAIFEMLAERGRKSGAISTATPSHHGDDAGTQTDDVIAVDAEQVNYQGN
jgi:DNA gyrase/topoisomerase IV subunit A